MAKTAKLPPAKAKPVAAPSKTKLEKTPINAKVVKEAKATMPTDSGKAKPADQAKATKTPRKAKVEVTIESKPVPVPKPYVGKEATPKAAQPPKLPAKKPAEKTEVATLQTQMNRIAKASKLTADVENLDPPRQHHTPVEQPVVQEAKAPAPVAEKVSSTLDVASTRRVSVPKTVAAAPGKLGSDALASLFRGSAAAEKPAEKPFFDAAKHLKR